MLNINTEDPIQLIKVDYVRSSDALVITYRNLKTNKKLQHVINEPEIEFYYNNVPLEDVERQNYTHREQLVPIKCQYKFITKYVVDLLQRPEITDFYNNCIQSKQFGQLNQIHSMDYRLFGSDVDIKDYYTALFINKYHNKDTIYKTTKAYFDIEVDLIKNNWKGFPNEEHAPCEVNLITYYFNKTSELFVFILKNEENESLMKWVDNIDAKKEKLKNSLLKYFNKYNLKLPEEFNIRMVVCDEEIELLYKFLQVKNIHKPDIIGAWNNKFDILTILNRLKKFIYGTLDDKTTINDFLLMKKVDKIFCNKCKVKNTFFYKDTRNIKPQDNGSYFSATDFSIYIDQMLNYAAIRKQKGKDDSNKLDFISNKELSVGKLEFKGEENVRNIAYLNFNKFVKYGCIDTILLHFLEEKTNDLDLVYNQSLKTFTRPNKIHKKTVFIKNLYANFLHHKDLIISNNFNNVTRSKEKFKGGYVASPMLNINNGITIKL